MNKTEGEIEKNIEHNNSKRRKETPVHTKYIYIYITDPLKWSCSRIDIASTAIQATICSDNLDQKQSFKQRVRLKVRIECLEKFEDLSFVTMVEEGMLTCYRNNFSCIRLIIRVPNIPEARSKHVHDLNSHSK